jgi:hypothetical protein
MKLPIIAYGEELPSQKEGDFHRRTRLIDALIDPHPDTKTFEN